MPKKCDKVETEKKIYAFSPTKLRLTVICITSQDIFWGVGEILAIQFEYVFFNIYKYKITINFWKVLHNSCNSNGCNNLSHQLIFDFTFM